MSLCLQLLYQALLTLCLTQNPIFADYENLESKQGLESMFLQVIMLDVQLLQALPERPVSQLVYLKTDATGFKKNNSMDCT